VRDRRQGYEESQRSPARLVVWGVALVLLVIFIAQNYLLVELRILFWRVDIHLIYALIGAGVLGFLIGWLLPRLRR
jgi:uncharacterized integral membrane protein